MRTSVSHHTTTTFEVEVDGSPVKLALSIEPSAIMDYRDECVRISPNRDKIVIGYLSDDSDCENPLEDCDGMGAIHTSRRHVGNAEHQAMQKALGLDSDWQPNLDLVDEDEARATVIQKLTSLDTVLERLQKNSGNLTATKIASEVFDERPDLSEPLLADAYRELWQKGRADGTIGDMLSVPLDVYEHSGVSYSVSGAGMQDEFDTSRGGAIWVPDDAARENIIFNAKKALLPDGTDVSYKSTGEKLNDITYTLPDRTEQGGFASFDAAITAAAAQLKIALLPEDINRHAKLQAIESAKEACAVYTDFCNGNTFCTVVEEFAITDSGEWESTNYDTVGGYIGDNYAIKEMRDTVNSIADEHKLENEAVFIVCDASALPVLQSMGAHFSQYHSNRHGVFVTMTDELQEKLAEFPADYVIHLREDSPAYQAANAVRAPSPDSTPTPGM